ncbi:outer membrane protein assembly factor BamE [Tepidimonas taiwanensis]|uniref:Outer membrane protein assembly factor BamE n=1 Tax=Tepidimonas taiwanensis TaxID=307486 RepID=A0A554WZ56_9BURK|nr:outer membrane protein assembly factor BamE [Tepidimonas taiwanensis]MCX7693010.1 outer membrane protein assembly factor BamE [Tepidimonas taiwanensis]TSE28845.1 Outer membrane protein assembly factor BamE [Tepidimonas taiwanensis]UBQ05192.1 outer membrane protein assembly factor BamE [Tepidimonas taiwanensis]
MNVAARLLTSLVARRYAWTVPLAGALLAGCASLDGATARLASLGGVITPYRMDILQGNVVVREQVQALQPGMTREQVQAILGTPLVASVFHANRWDYVFTLQRQGQPPQRRVVTVFFDGDRLARVQADELPTEEEFVASLAARRPAGQAPALEASEEQLRAFEAKGTSAPATPPSPEAAPDAAAASTARSYPPLEPR